MDNYIVNETCSNIRFLARQSLKGMWKPSLLAVLLVTICTTVPSILFEAMFGGFSEEVMMGSSDTITAGSVVAAIYSLLITGAFTFGTTVYFLDLVRERKADVGQIFSGFGYYFKTFGLMIVVSVFTFLWALLLIVPGVIAAIRYSQAYYILADDPSKGIMQCIRESKEMMKGNKAKYFSLQLSFIGWYALAVTVLYVVIIGIVVVVIFFPMSSSAITAVMITFVTLVATVIIVPLTPYVQAASTVFYEMANGNLRREEAPEPMMPLTQNIQEEPALAENVPEPVLQNMPEIKIETSDNEEK